MIKIILAAMFVCVLSPSDVWAQTSLVSSKKFVEVPMRYTLELELVEIESMPPRIPGEFGEKQFWVSRDSLAPFDGVLLNPEAMAFILSEYKASYERFLLTLNKQRDLDLSVLNLEVGKLKLEINAINTKNQILTTGKDKEIVRLKKINKEQLEDRSGFKKKLFIGLGTGLAGIVAGFIVGATVL